MALPGKPQPGRRSPDQQASLIPASRHADGYLLELKEAQIPPPGLHNPTAPCRARRAPGRNWLLCLARPALAGRAGLTRRSPTDLRSCSRSLGGSGARPIGRQATGTNAGSPASTTVALPRHGHGAQRLACAAAATRFELSDRAPRLLKEAYCWSKPLARQDPLTGACHKKNPPPPGLAQPPVLRAGATTLLPRLLACGERPNDRPFVRRAGWGGIAGPAQAGCPQPAAPRPACPPGANFYSCRPARPCPPKPPADLGRRSAELLAELANLQEQGDEPRPIWPSRCGARPRWRNVAAKTPARPGVDGGPARWDGPTRRMCGFEGDPRFSLLQTAAGGCHLRISAVPPMPFLNDLLDETRRRHWSQRLDEPEQEIPWPPAPPRGARRPDLTASSAWAYGAAPAGLIDSANGSSAHDLGEAYLKLEAMLRATEKKREEEACELCPDRAGPGGQRLNRWSLVLAQPGDTGSTDLLDSGRLLPVSREG